MYIHIKILEGLYPISTWNGAKFSSSLRRESRSVSKARGVFLLRVNTGTPPLHRECIFHDRANDVERRGEEGGERIRMKIEILVGKTPVPARGRKIFIMAFKFRGHSPGLHRAFAWKCFTPRPPREIMILGTFEETTRGKIPPRASVTTLARRRVIIKICGISIFSFFSPESAGEGGEGTNEIFSCKYRQEYFIRYRSLQSVSIEILVTFK